MPSISVGISFPGVSLKKTPIQFTMTELTEVLGKIYAESGKKSLDERIEMQKTAEKMAKTCGEVLLYRNCALQLAKSLTDRGKPGDLKEALGFLDKALKPTDVAQKPPLDDSSANSKTLVLEKLSQSLEPKIYEQMACVYWKRCEKGDLGKIISSAQIGFCLNPQDPDLLANLALHVATAFARLEEHPKALIWFKKAASISAVSSELQKEIEEGTKQSQEIVDKTQSGAEALLFLGKKDDSKMQE